MDLMLAFAQYCETEIGRLRNDIAVMQRGDFRMWKKEGGGPEIDLTEGIIARDTKQIAELEVLLRKARERIAEGN